MAQINDVGISLGGERIVAAISINGGEIRGEGGALRPQIVIPVKFKLNQHSVIRSATDFKKELGNKTQRRSLHGGQAKVAR